MAIAPTDQKQEKAIAYRPEIDGLRAVAIIAVMLYHLNPDWLPGGFVGVDVFFVISGFLISSIILHETDLGIFSFRRFYSRRIKRLFPAMATVLLAVLVCQAVVQPFNYDIARRTGIWVLGLAGNIYIWMTTGDYFAPTTENPLLHTWSLGVEEQFYLSFPLILFVLSRFNRRRILPIIAALAAVSFLWCIVTTSSKPTDSFYLLPSRAWELLIGCTLAVAVADHRALFDRFPYKKAVAAFGISCLGISLFLINSGSDFPGWKALFPTLGGALLIAFVGKDASYISRLLRSQSMVHVGKISYSLYLWHWPVTLIFKEMSESPLVPAYVPGWVTPLAIVIVSFALAEASYRWVESPLRLYQFTPVLSFAVAMLLLLGMGGLKQKHLMGRFESVDTSLFAPITDRGPLYQPSKKGVTYKSRHVRTIVRESSDQGNVGTTRKYGGGSLDVMVVGDSHALRMAFIVDEWLRTRNLTGKFFCDDNLKPSFLDMELGNNTRWSPDQEDLVVAARKAFDFEHPKLVVWVSRNDRRKYEDFAPALRRILETTPCIFVQQPPVLNIGDGLCTIDQFGYYKIKLGLDLNKLNIVEKRSVTLKRKSFDMGLLAEFGANNRFIYVETTTAFLQPDGKIRWWDGVSKINYIDDDHLSEYGAELLKPRLLLALDQAIEYGRKVR